MIYILHPQKDVILGYLDREDYWDDKHHQATDGVHFIEFSTFSDTAEAGMLVDRCRLLRQASTGGWQEFVAYHIGARGDRTKQIVATGAEAELDRLKVMEPGWRSGYTLEQYMNQALAGTRMELGMIDYGGSKSRYFDKHMGGYAFLNRVAGFYGREIRRRVEVIDNRIAGRYWDMVERLGSDKRHEIVAGENMAGITREVFSDRIVTALYCVGPEREDGTRLTVLVTDDDAFQRWNWHGQHIIDFYEPETDDEEMTLVRLTTLGTTELKKRIVSVVKYTIEAAVLPDDDVELGDTQWIKDEDFEPPLYAESRAIVVIEPISGDVSKRTYEFGETRELKEEDVLKTFRHLQKVYGMRVVRSPVPPAGSPSKIWVKTDLDAPAGSGLEVQHIWNTEAAEWVKVTPTAAGEVGAEPEIPTGPLPPDPAISNKWVDTSGLLAELKMWNADTRNWDSVQGPPGADGIDGQDGIDGYTPVKGTDYFDGVDGQDGTDGTSSYVWIRYAQVSSGSGMVDSPTNAKYIGVATTQTAVAPADPAAYRWTLIKGTDGVPGEPGTDGKSSYLHIKYSNDGGATFTASNGEAVGDWIGTYVDFTLTDSNSPTAYTWNKVKGEKGETGSQGLQGIQGPRGDQGIAGATGADGRTSYTHIAYSTSPTGSTGFSVNDPAGKTYIGMYTDFVAADSTNPALYNWSLIKGADGSQGIAGPKGVDGQTSYLHIAYATNATGSVGFSMTVSTGKTYIGQYTDFISADSTNPALYSWTLIKGDKGDAGATGPQGLQGVQGPQGDQGIPGVKGVDGQTSYTHIAYADSAAGSSFSQDPAGKAYIGMYTDFTAADSADTTKYAWSLIKGADGSQGVPGPKGADGQTPYLHIAYATNATGTVGFSTTDSVGKTYIGTYTDFVAADSNTASLYSWSLIKGDKGDKGETGSQGLQGIQGPTGNQGIQGVAGANGQTSYTHIAYATNSTGTAGFSVSDPANKTYIGMYTDFTATDSTNPAVYKWTLIKGADGSQGIQGPTGASGQSPYLHIAYATNATGTAGFDTVVSAGKTYIGTYTDFVSADSTDPAKYSWTLIKGEKGDTGTPGAQGIQGPVGPQGQTLYTWVKYADTPTTGLSDSPTGKTYIGLAYNKTTPTESSNYLDYAWSLIKGADGVQGVQGPPGSNGQTTYTWVKYADDAMGNGMSDLPDGKRFLGLAYNKTTATESTNKADYGWSPLYDNVIVGGRNLAFNSNFSTGDLSKWNNNGAVTFAKIDGRNTAKMGTTSGIYQTMSTEETVYTYSFMAKALDSTTTANVGFLNVAGNARKVFNLTTSWAKYSHTTGVPVPVGQLLHIYSNGKTYQITDIKVEKGNVATDYTTAPEDVEKLMEDKAAAAEKNAKDFVVEYAGKKISRGPLPPTDPGEGDMWIDSSMGEDIWKRFNGIAWELAVYVTTDMISALGIDAGVIKFGTMAGATVLLGGANNENGVLIVNSSAGEPIAELNGDAGGFPFLSVGYIDAPNKVEYGNYTDEPLTYYVAPMQFNSYNEPSDENDGFGWNSSLRTIQEAIDRIPKFFDGTVRISLAYGQTFYEDIDISGFSGSGTLIIERSAETTRPTLRGSVNITNNNVRIEWRNVNVDATDDYAGFFIQNSCGLMADVSIIGASGNTGFAINVNTGGSFELYRIYMANVNTCIRASYGGYAYVSACTGSGATYGLQGFAGSIMGGGTAPTGGTSNTAASFGGQVTGSWSYPTPPAPPAPITKTVTTKWTANSDSGTWRTDYAAWDIYASANQVTQGSYAGNGAFRGAWFFGTGVASTLTGKTIRRIRIYMRRERGGASGTVAARIRPHTSSSRPSGNVSVQSPSYNAGFSVGEGKWVTLPTSFHAGFTSGSYKGLSIDGTAYMKFIKSAVLEITYET